MTADLFKTINKSADRILTNTNDVDEVKIEICDKCRMQYDKNLNQEQLDEKCQSCIVELIKGFVF